jgi:hypothetical protein
MVCVTSVVRGLWFDQRVLGTIFTSPLCACTEPNSMHSHLVWSGTTAAYLLVKQHPNHCSSVSAAASTWCFASVSPCNPVSRGICGSCTWQVCTASFCLHQAAVCNVFGGTGTRWVVHGMWCWCCMLVSRYSRSVGVPQCHKDFGTAGRQCV